MKRTTALRNLLLKGRLMMKGEVGQLNEALCKVLCHNICVLIQEAQANNVFAEFEKDAHKFEHLHTNSVPSIKDG